MPVPSTRRISENGPRGSQSGSSCSTPTRPGRKSVWRRREGTKGAMPPFAMPELGRLRGPRMGALLLLGMSSLAVSPAAAVPLTPFRYEAQAQRHCPGDTVVWLDFRKGVYYSKGQRYYARGFNGSFVCRNEARGSGYRRSPLGLR